MPYGKEYKCLKLLNFNQHQLQLMKISFLKKRDYEWPGTYGTRWYTNIFQLVKMKLIKTIFIHRYSTNSTVELSLNQAQYQWTTIFTDFKIW